MDSQKFGTFISELRKERGWTQLELAQKLNVTDAQKLHCIVHSKSPADPVREQDFF